MPKIVREILIRAPLEDSWALVSDMERFSLCIPGCKEVKKIGDTEFDWLMEFKVMRTTRKAKVRTKATLLQAPSRQEFVGEGRLFERSNYYKLTITGATDLERVSDAKTKITFSGDVSASGVGGAIIDKVAAGQMDELFGEFEKNLKHALGDVGDDEMEDDAAAAPVAEARTQSDDHSKTRMAIAVIAGVIGLAVIIYYLML